MSWSLFVWAGLYKVARPIQTAEFLAALTSSEATPWQSIVRVVAGAEWALGLWLVSAWSHRIALRATTCALVLLTVILAIAKLKGVSAPCGCTGIDENIGVSLVRNGSLILAASVGLVLSGSPRVVKAEQV